MTLDPRKAREELARRKVALAQAGEVEKSIRKELFANQLAFMDDPARNKGALCTRRAGKTSMWSRYAPIVALKNPRAIIRIWAISRLRAKQLLWQELLDVCARHKVKVRTHETELTIRFENGAEIRLLGADKDKEAQKKRGDKTILEVILEAQLFGPFLRTLVEDVAEPCLFDLQGTMCLEGTPGPVPTGYWYWVTGEEAAPEVGNWQSGGMLVSTGTDDERERVGAGWSCHRWSLLNNPHLPHAREELERIRQKRGWTPDVPTYVREYLGKWVRDDGALFYKFNEGRNTYAINEIQPWGNGWKHVLGWDLGYRDDMALVVWGWKSDSRALYEAASWSKPGVGSEEVMEVIEKWERMGFNFIAKVADTQGGGKMYVEDVMSRYSQVFEPAKKSEKLDHVRLMNDDFVAGRLKLQRGGPYATEISALPKDPDWDADSGKPPGEDPRFPNHLCFVAGTLILTAEGEKPIEQVRVGDLVLTRAGWKPVTHAQSTGEQEVVTRVGLTGTPEHPVLTTRGWVRLDSLADSDVVLYARSSQGQSSGVGLSGIASLSPSGDLIVSTTSRALVDGTGISIEPSTKPLTGPSLVAGTSITSTVTRSTTSRLTSALGRALNTSPSTAESAGSPSPNQYWQRLKRRAQRLLAGIAQTRAVLGTESTHFRWQLRVSAVCNSVSSVEHFLRSRQHRGSAPRNAAIAGTHESAEGRASTTRLALAESAESPSSSTSTASSRAAVVYALSVADQHEYFANGVLVSNCDAALYSWRKALNYLDFEPEEKEQSIDDRIEAADEERFSSTEEEDWWRNPDYD